MKEIVDSPPLSQLERLLDNLQQRIDTAERPEQKARMFNLAGDMCFDARQLERALAYYDKAITSYTSCENYAAAARLCEKILAISPDSVRPYYTLASLSLKRGNTEDACRWIRDYVAAAEAHGLARIARQFLLSLAEVTEAESVLESLAAGLRKLNDPEHAEQVLGRIPA